MACARLCHGADRVVGALLGSVLRSCRNGFGLLASEPRRLLISPDISLGAGHDRAGIDADDAPDRADAAVRVLGDITR